MKLNPSDTIALGGLLLATITATISGMFWFANSEKKRYGLERDFSHLRRNQENMQQGIDTLLKEHDKRFDQLDRQLLEIKNEIRMPKTAA